MKKYLKPTPEEVIVKMGENERAFQEGGPRFWTVESIARLMCTSKYQASKIVKYLKHHGNLQAHCAMRECLGDYMPYRHLIITSTGWESFNKLTGQ